MESVRQRESGSAVSPRLAEIVRKFQNQSEDENNALHSMDV